MKIGYHLKSSGWSSSSHSFPLVSCHLTGFLIIFPIKWPFLWMRRRYPHHLRPRIPCTSIRPRRIVRCLLRYREVHILPQRGVFPSSSIGVTDCKWGYSYDQLNRNGMNWPRHPLVLVWCSIHFHVFLRGYVSIMASHWIEFGIIHGIQKWGYTIHCWWFLGWSPYGADRKSANKSSKQNEPFGPSTPVRKLLAQTGGQSRCDFWFIDF